MDKSAKVCVSWMFGDKNMSFVNVICLFLREDGIACFKWARHR